MKREHSGKTSPRKVAKTNPQKGVAAKTDPQKGVAANVVKGLVAEVFLEL